MPNTRGLSSHLPRPFLLAPPHRRTRASMTSSRGNSTPPSRPSDTTKIQTHCSNAPLAPRGCRMEASLSSIWVKRRCVVSTPTVRLQREFRALAQAPGKCSIWPGCFDAETNSSHTTFGGTAFQFSTWMASINENSDSKFRQVSRCRTRRHAAAIVDLRTLVGVECNQSRVHIATRCHCGPPLLRTANT